MMIMIGEKEGNEEKRKRVSHTGSRKKEGRKEKEAEGNEKREG